MERTSERIWRAARAHYEIWERFQEYWEAGQVLSWDEVLQDRRDLEYDAMVAAFDAASVPALKARVADHPGCMAPDGAEPCPQYTALVERVKVMEHLQAGFQMVRDDQQKRIAELEAEVRRLQNNEENDCDLLGMNERRIEALEAALKPFAEYAEYIEKERPGWFHHRFTFMFGAKDAIGDIEIRMKWFIAALKAYRGKDAPPSEDKE